MFVPVRPRPCRRPTVVATPPVHLGDLVDGFADQFFGVGANSPILLPVLRWLDGSTGSTDWVASETRRGKLHH